MKRKICFVITSAIHYSRNFLILEELEKNENVELHIILGGSVIHSKYISKNFNVKNILIESGITNIHDIHFNLDGDELVVKAKTVGLGIIEFASIFNEIKPDLIVVRGDRFEVLASVVAAAYMAIPVAHIEGGDLSGTLDESVRHAITKLSNFHFATNEDAEKRLLRMGEQREYVFNFGSPDVEVVQKMLKEDLKIKEINFDNFGSGYHFNPSMDYLIVMFHPVYSEIDKLASMTRSILNVVNQINIHQVIWFWPNDDAGSDKKYHELRTFKDNHQKHRIKFLRYLPPRQFLSLLTKTKCLVGNSSAGIKECSYLGIPVVNIGSRQNQRLKTENVINCDCTEDKLKKAIEQQLEIGRYSTSEVYSKSNTSKNIVNILVNCNLYIQKKFID